MVIESVCIVESSPFLESLVKDLGGVKCVLLEHEEPLLVPFSVRPLLLALRSKCHVNGKVMWRTRE